MKMHLSIPRPFAFPIVHSAARHGTGVPEVSNGMACAKAVCRLKAERFNTSDLRIAKRSGGVLESTSMKS
jgi:hypothetical protein